MNHARHEKPDMANGFPGGIRLSWPALTVLIGVLALVFMGANAVQGMQGKRLDRIDEKLDRIEQNFLDHVSQHSPVSTGSMTLGQRPGDHVSQHPSMSTWF